MMVRRVPILAVALTILFQAASAQQAPSFRAETRLVVLHATVRDSRGELITNLSRSAFTVFENGRPQPVTLFRRDDIPVSLGLLIDNSGSMRSVRSKVESAALAFARASNPLDEMFVLNFADKARVDVPFTRDVRVLEAGIARADSIGGTALHDAVEMGEAYLRDHAVYDRRVLLAITDGIDNASVAPIERIRQQAERFDTAIYAVGLFGTDDEARTKRGRHELEQLTARTGGVPYFPSGPDQIDEVVLDIARQIRNQYTIAYAPLNQALDGSYRTIRVTATGAERYVVRTRGGYRAAPQNPQLPGS